MKHIPVILTADDNKVVWAANEKGEYEATSNPESDLPKIPPPLVKHFLESGRESLSCNLRLE